MLRGNCVLGQFLCRCGTETSEVFGQACVQLRGFTGARRDLVAGGVLSCRTGQRDSIQCKTELAIAVSSGFFGVPLETYPSLISHSMTPPRPFDLA